MSIISTLVTISSAVSVIGGSLYLPLAGVAMWRSRDALSRSNQLSVRIMVGTPALVIANLILEVDQGDLTWGRTLTAIPAVVAILVVATVAPEVLGRAAPNVRDGSAEDYVPEW